MTWDPLTEPHNGRTVWDFVDGHVSTAILASAVLILLAILACVVLIDRLDAGRAKKEGREYRGIGGLTQIGPRHSAPQSEPPDAQSAAAENAQNGAMAIIGAALEVSTALDAITLREAEAYLLYALVQGTKGNPYTRRASILKVRRTEDDEVMEVHECYPERRFAKRRSTFSRRMFKKQGRGLCWFAVEECCDARHGGAGFDKPERYVFYASDVTKNDALVETNGARFKSIMIASVFSRKIDAQGDAQDTIVGAVCLDSDKTNHYEEADRRLVATAALALSLAWRVRELSGGPCSAGPNS